MSSEDLSTNQTAEEEAAEEAAFSAAFTEERGEAAEPQNTEPPVEEVAQEPAPDGGSAPEPVAEAETAKTVLAGLTEEQVAQALARVSQQQMTIDKLGGRIGQLMQQVEKLNSQPRTAAEQRSFDVKLDKLSKAFPELAEILAEDLKNMGGVPAAASQQVEQTTQSFTAEDVDRIVNEKLTTFKVQQERALEVKVLGSAHPDWEQVIRTPQFALWRDNVIADGKDLMESENAAYISRKLTEFKDWVKATTSPVHQQAQAQARTPAPAPSKDRLRQAVMPSGAQVQNNGPVSEEEAFAVAFAKERSKSGY